MNILLLHGAIGATDQLESLKQKLVEADPQWRVHTLNFSGHGGEAMPEDFSISRFADEVKTYLGDKQLTDVHVFGYSMGGYVALYMHGKYPGRIKSVVTCGTKFLWTPDIASREVQMLDPDVITKKVPAFARFLDNRHQPNDWKEVLGKTKDMMLAVGVQPPLSLDDLRNIDIPVTVCLGDVDSMVTRDESEAAAAALPHGTFKLLENTPHAMEKMDVDKLVAVIVGRQ